MPSVVVGQTPSLGTFLKSLKTHNVETSIELFISLLKRRQIKNSRSCAIATAQLLLHVVAAEKSHDVQKLIARVRAVGRRLVAAQPREMAVGNIVRRVLGVIREVGEEDHEVLTDSGELSPVPGEAQRPKLPTNFSGLSPLNQGMSMVQSLQRSATPDLDYSPDRAAASRRPGLQTSISSYAAAAAQPSSILSLLEHPLGRSPIGTPPGARTPQKGKDASGSLEKLDIKAEIVDGIKDLLEELDVVDAQIAESALDHIHSNETILTHTSSQTVQKFLMTAARKRKFTVVHAEAYPNDHEATHATIVNGGKKLSGDDDDVDERWRPLTAMGITVILIPDTAVFALMARINKVILAPHSVLANGSLIAASGASTVALAAKAHKVPVIVLSGVYKLSPVYPFDTEELIEYGDPGKVAPFQDGEFMDKVDVMNPVFDWVDAENVDLYITNLGGCAPSFLYRIVADHYYDEDIALGGKVG